MSDKVQLKNLEVDGERISSAHTVDVDWSSEEFEKRTSIYSPGLRIAIRKRFLMLKSQRSREKTEGFILNALHNFKQMTERTKLDIIYEMLLRDRYERKKD